jgi:hypothetical protein
MSQKMQAATTLQDIEQIFRDAVGVIDAQAGSGEIEIDEAFDQRQLFFRSTTIRFPVCPS